MDVAGVLLSKHFFGDKSCRSRNPVDLLRAARDQQLVEDLWCAVQFASSLRLGIACTGIDRPRLARHADGIGALCRGHGHGRPHK